MATALLTHEACLGHVTPDGHPEQVARLAVILEALSDLELSREQAPLVEDAALLRVHPQSHLDRIASALPVSGQVALDEDTWLSPGSLEAARRAAGAAVRAVDLVLSGEAANAFCATRPPGHHAETEKPMGFCLFGNAAVAAKHALDQHQLARVAIVDFDVHHGNGTQDLLWQEPRALVITSQQRPLWPGTGSPSERGPHDTVLNLPLAPGSEGRVMEQVFELEAFPRLRDFAPELVIISAGFDAHRADPLAQLNWETADFAWLTRRICQIASASGAPVVSVLEGGYDLGALAAASRAHVQALIEAGSRFAVERRAEGVNG